MLVIVSDIDLHLQELGLPAGAPLLLLHSIGTQSAIWEETVAALSDRYRTLRVDLRDHGLSYAGAAEAIAGVDLTATSRRLRNPTLVLVGEMDVATPLASAQALRDVIPGAELVVISKAAHLPMMEQAPAVAIAMPRFFAELEPREE